MHSSSSSSNNWAEWVPRCLQPVVAIACELPYRHHSGVGHRLEAMNYDFDYADFEVEDRYSHSYSTVEDDIDDVEEQQLQFHHHLSRIPHTRQQQQQQQGGKRKITCIACKEAYSPLGAGTCRECYEEASETEEVLRKEIEELNSRITFLKTWALEVMSEGFTDLVLEASDGSKIRAHRAVLVSRSSVFKAMFDTEMKESKSGTIKITDYPYEVLKLFVHYLYTADIYPESLEESALDLLALAEKYNVKQLKSVCERFLVLKLNNDNVLFSYEYACQHGARALKEAALATILENIHELTTKDEYRELVNRDAKLVVEIYEAYLAKKTK